MATTYKLLSASGTEPLTARIYADDIEIHSSHRLDACTTYQWFHDTLNMDGTSTGGTMVAGQTTQTYNLPLSTVANSGDYWCVITVGNCRFETERRRISIINRFSPERNLFTADAGTGQFIIEAPHYELPVFNNENSFVVAGTLVPCATQTANVCTFVQNYSISANPTPSSPREAQVSMTVGELSIFFNVGQDRVLTQDDTPITRKGPDGPFINLTQDGPALAQVPSALIVPATITVTAEVGIVGGTLGAHTITYSDDRGGSGTGSTYEVANPGYDVNNIPTETTNTDIVVTATVTDTATGLTATETITVRYIFLVVAQPTMTMGDVVGRIQWQVLQGLGFGGTVRGEGYDSATNTVTRRGTFTVTGDGNWNIALNWYDGFFGARSDDGMIVLSFSGPGAPANVTVSPSNTSRTVEVTGLTGTFEWTLTMSGIDSSTTNYANGGLTLLPRNF